MSLKSTVLLFTIACLAVSCVNDGSKNTNSNSSENSITQKMTRKPTSDLARKLYENFHADPQTQAQKDENDLIDYAVDKGLDAKKMASGLYYVVQKEGTGLVNTHGQPFKAHYSGYFLDGKVFDSSINRGVPLMAKIGQMIPAWNEALTTFPVGSKLTLLVPSHLAYGANGFPGFVPPNKPLIFDMEILPVITKEG